MVCELRLLVQQVAFMYIATLVLVSLMYIRYTGCPRSGQPLPKPRAELAFAVDVPDAPLLLHREI